MEFNYKIFENEDVLFFDCCGISGQGDWFKWAVKSFDSYNHLNLATIETEIEHQKRIVPLIVDSNKSRFFTPKVVQEIEIFNNILENKFHWLEKNKGRISISRDKRARFMDIKKLYSIMKDIASSEDNHYQPPENSRFEEYNDFIVRLAKKYELKKKPEYFDAIGFDNAESKTNKKPKVDNWTDEEVIASAITYSVGQKERCGIITRDYDFGNILRYSLVYMLDEGKYCDELNILKKHPVRVYNLFNGCIFDSKQIIGSVLKNRKLYFGLEEKLRKLNLS